MDIVLMPNYNRPEYLYWCLEHVKKAEGADCLHYMFLLDWGYDKQLLDIIDKFPYSKEIYETEMKEYGFSKQSYNVLNGFKIACERDCKYIGYLEEDIFVSNDYFKWHYKIHEKEPNIFCSIASKNHNTKIDIEGNETQYYLNHTIDYQGWAVFFRKEIVQKYILPHINNDYFSDPFSYCKQFYSELNENFIEQDGLIRRIKEYEGMSAAFPITPRAYHAGIYGYHKQTRETKPDVKELDELIKFIGEVCFNPQKMKEHDPLGDSEVCDLTISEWQDLVCVADYSGVENHETAFQRMLREDKRNVTKEIQRILERKGFEIKGKVRIAKGEVLQMLNYFMHNPHKMTVVIETVKYYLETKKSESNENKEGKDI